MKYKSSLSMKRIIISLLIYAAIPFVCRALTGLIGNETAAMTLTLNLAGLTLIVYDWNLFGIHYNRAKDNPGDTVIYTLIGIVLIGLLTWISRRFLHAFIPLPDPATVRAYLFALPPILCAYSLTLGLIINISFKCLTDHLDIRDREALIILASGFMFGMLYTAAFCPLADFPLIVRTYLYNVLLICIMSYLYNQSSSFIPGILSFTAVMLALQYLTIYA